MGIGCLRVAIFSLAVAGAGAAQQPSDFDGTWVIKANGLAVMKLTIAVGSGGVAGSLTTRRQLTIDQDGNVTKIGEGQKELPIQAATIKDARLELTIDGDRYTVTLDGRDRAIVTTEFGEKMHMRPWGFDRVPDASAAVLATNLPETDFPPDIRALRQRLSAMVKEDQDVRLAFDLKAMEAVDAKNRAEVLGIFDRYGWVTNSLAGTDAAHDYWLLIQHQTAEIQQRLLPSLEKAAMAGDASRSDYAYLYDRVQMGLGKPQRWGSQTICENGKPVLYKVDDPEGLDQRRKELFLMPIGEYLTMDYLVKFCAQAAR